MYDDVRQNAVCLCQQHPVEPNAFSPSINVSIFVLHHKMKLDFSIPMNGPNDAAFITRCVHARNSSSSSSSSLSFTHRPHPSGPHCSLCYHSVMGTARECSSTASETSCWCTCPAATSSSSTAGTSTTRAPTSSSPAAGSPPSSPNKPSRTSRPLSWHVPPPPPAPASSRFFR